MISLLFLVFGLLQIEAKQPNIVFILADDLGYNDVPWQNTDGIAAPTIELLATQNAVILNQSYVNFLCSPSRSALMTGYFPFHTGMQDGILKGLMPKGIPLKYPFFPEKLKKLGYSNYMVGKWHLGFCNKAYLPISRGFDEFFGYHTGSEDHYTHMTGTEGENTETTTEYFAVRREGAGRRRRQNNGEERVRNGRSHNNSGEGYGGNGRRGRNSSDGGPGKKGKSKGGKNIALDFWENDKAQWGYNGQYSTEVFADRSIHYMSQHDKSKPFFLYLAFQAVHTPLEVPDKYRVNCKQERQDRNLYCGMISAMDVAVRRVVNYLKENDLYDDTIIIFSSDNGGEIVTGGASNWPLRGNKGTLWEGGCRATSFIHSPTQFKSASVNNDLFHIVDWYATVLGMAGSDITNYGDGYNQWPHITSDGGDSPPRDEVVYNINPVAKVLAHRNVSGSAVRQGKFKMIQGFPGHVSGAFPPSEAGKGDESRLIGQWLYDLEEDPTEKTDVSSKYPDIVKTLEFRIEVLISETVPSITTGHSAAGKPENFNNTWSCCWCDPI